MTLFLNKHLLILLLSSPLMPPFINTTACPEATTHLDTPPHLFQLACDTIQFHTVSAVDKNLFTLWHWRPEVEVMEK